MSTRQSARRRRSLGSRFGLAALLALSCEGAAASEFCAHVTRLVEGAHSNFADWPRGEAEPMAAPAMADAERCSLVLILSGARVYQCAWTFDHRSDAAYAAFESFDRSLQSCLGDSAQVERDRRVNHPDFYDQRRYRVARAEVTLSVKDKSALQHTYVFVRVQGVPDA